MEPRSFFLRAGLRWRIPKSGMAAQSNVEEGGGDVTSFMIAVIAVRVVRCSGTDVGNRARHRSCGIDSLRRRGQLRSASSNERCECALLRKLMLNGVPQGAASGGDSAPLRNTSGGSCAEASKRVPSNGRSRNKTYIEAPAVAPSVASTSSIVWDNRIRRKSPSSRLALRALRRSPPDVILVI
jgi:hypothetical protein